MSVLELFNDEQRVEVKKELYVIVQEIVSDVLKDHIKVKSESLGVKAACDVLGIGRASLMTLVEQGKIKYRMNGNRYKFDERDLEYYKAKNNIQKKIRGI